ncbi:MAG: hypothetical protein SFZ24_01795 [Planctomycetota bacterium]|nr:hypothetical protein [Planctomycetota bacterium]
MALRRPALAAAFALVSFAAATVFAQNADLSPGPKEGSSYRFGLSERLEIRTMSKSLPGGSQLHVMQSDVLMRVKSLPAEPEGPVYEVTFDRVKFVSQHPTAKRNPAFDTGAPADEAAGNELAPVLLPLLNKPIRVSLDTSGRLREVRTPDQSLIPDVDFAGIGRQFFMPEWIGPRLLPVVSMGTAETAAAVGTRWSIPSESPVLFGVDQPMNISTEFVVREIQPGQIARVELSGTATLQPQRSGDPVSAKLDSLAVTGEAVWDLQSRIMGQILATTTWAVQTSPGENLEVRTENIRRLHVARLQD